MSNFIVECIQLSKVYYDAEAKIEVLKSINLQVKPGELIAIVGNSGSGKSTLLHLLGGLDKPTSGAVMVNGNRLSTLSEKSKCRLRNQYLGFVYQFHHLLPEFSALENVSMPLLIRGMPSAKVKLKATHLLKLVGLETRMTHKMGELSGGERQRVAIARALVADPLCILADEPTGNLDPFNARTILKLFIDLQQTLQTSVVIVTHDINIAKQAQRVLTLQEGSLVEI